MRRLRHYAPVIAFLAVAIVSSVGILIAQDAAKQAIAAGERAEGVAVELADANNQRAEELAAANNQRAEELAAETQQQAEKLAADSRQRTLDVCERSADVRQVILDLLDLQEPPIEPPPGAAEALVQFTEEEAARQKRFLAVAQRRLEAQPCDELADQ